MTRKVLLNHALPGGDVTDGYVRPSGDFLRGEVERVGAFLLARMAPPAPTGDGRGTGPSLREERRPI
ncbi:MAG: hypothetical protein L0323_19665 [Planctomycetes bacterium]|nr:hypothetical protein [Planctomycetota bacterium]